MFQSSDWMARANAAAGILGYVGAIARRQRCHPGPAIVRAGGIRRQRMDSRHCSRFSRVPPASDAGRRARQPRRHQRFRSQNSAGAGASRRSAGEPAHDGRGADAFDHSSRDSKSRSNVWRCIIWRARTAISASRCSRTGPTPHHRDCAGRRRASRRGRRGIARLNQRYGPAPEGARFFLLHRRRIWNEGQGKWIGWERKRGKLHELNRLLRGATDTTFVAIDGQPAHRALRRSLRDHARRRYATAARDRQAPGRQDGASAQPSAAGSRIAVAWSRATRCCSRGSRRRCRAGREGSLFQRVFTSPSGLDPYAFAVSDVYQDLFGEGSYSGKGIYDVDVFEAALDGRAPGEHPPQSRSARGNLRAGRIGLRHRGRRRVSLALRRRRGSPASVGARRLAIAALDFWPRAGFQRRSAPRSAIPLIRPLEDDRQPAAHAVGAGRVPRIAGRMDAASAAAAVWSGFVVATFAIPAFLPAFIGIVPRRLGLSQRRHWHAVGAGFRPRAVADRAAGHAPRASGVADGRRDCANPLPSVREASAAARMGHRGAGEAHDQLDLRGSIGWMAGGVALAAAAVAVVASSDDDAWPVAAPFVVLWIALAGRRAMGESSAAAWPASDRYRPPTHERCG